MRFIHFIINGSFKIILYILYLRGHFHVIYHKKIKENTTTNNLHFDDIF